MIIARFDVLIVRASAQYDGISIKVTGILERLGLTWTSVWGDWKSISDYVMAQHPVRLVVFCGTNSSTAELVRQVRGQKPKMPIFIIAESADILVEIGIDDLIQFFNLPGVARAFGFRSFVEFEPAVFGLGITRSTVLTKAKTTPRLPDVLVITSSHGVTIITLNGDDFDRAEPITPLFQKLVGLFVFWSGMYLRVDEDATIYVEDRPIRILVTTAIHEDKQVYPSPVLKFIGTSDHLPVLMVSQS